MGDYSKLPEVFQKIIEFDRSREAMSSNNVIDFTSGRRRRWLSWEAVAFIRNQQDPG